MRCFLGRNTEYKCTKCALWWPIRLMLAVYRIADREAHCCVAFFLCGVHRIVPAGAPRVEVGHCHIAQRAILLVRIEQFGVCRYPPPCRYRRRSCSVISERGLRLNENGRAPLSSQPSETRPPCTNGRTAPERLRPRSNSPRTWP